MASLLCLVTQMMFYTVISGRDVLGSLYLWTSISWDSGALPAHVHLTYCDYHQQQKNKNTTLLPLHLVSTTQFIFLGEVSQTDSNKSIKTETWTLPLQSVIYQNLLELVIHFHGSLWRTFVKNLLSLVQLITEILLYANSTFYITWQERDEISKYISGLSMVCVCVCNAHTRVRFERSESP